MLFRAAVSSLVLSAGACCGWFCCVLVESLQKNRKTSPGWCSTPDSLKKIGQKSFLGRKVGRRRNATPTAPQTAHRTPGTPPGYTNTPTHKNAVQRPTDRRTAYTNPTAPTQKSKRAKENPGGVLSLRGGAPVLFRFVHSA